jgi:biotin-dependent carboxylase-like uncharacterized protein
MIEVLHPGPYACVQDLGRAGYAHLGVARSGAFDRAALALANRLVGNSPTAAAVEITLGGFTLLAEDAVTVCLTGAACPGMAWGVPITLPSGSTLSLGTPSTGLRSYLAFRGGVEVAAELGSRSTDTLGGLGPAPLRAGERLPIGRSHPGGVSGSAAVPAPLRQVLRVVPGPRDDWFVDAIANLTSSAWTVRADSDRIGVRLHGQALQRSREDELPSEPTVPGALQVPPDGLPILLGPDAPVTGGYPVIAVVREADLDIAAQLRPGHTVRFSAPTA